MKPTELGSANMPVADTTPWKLNYVEAGSGPTVLLIHGLAGDHKAWLPQIEMLKGQYRVVALDNPGAGLSSNVTRPVAIADMAKAFLQLMDLLDIKTANLVGRSMGGVIAQEIALAAPHRVRSLAMAGSFAKLDALGNRLIENMRDYIAAGHSWTEWSRLFSFAFVSIDFFLDDAARMERLEHLIADEARDKPSYINLANACLSSNTVGRLSQLKCPALVMGGRDDPICSPRTTEQLAKQFTSIESVFFEKSSHFFLMEEPAKAGETILSWLKKQS
jgi:3-oxoadipate enol-lactonase